MTYLREPLEAPKVVVWVERAGWWCLSAFLTRRVMPPFSAETTPMACLNQHVSSSRSTAALLTLSAIWPSFLRL